MATHVVSAAVVAALFLEESSEEEETWQASRQHATLARTLRDRPDPFDIPERQFRYVQFITY